MATASGAAEELREARQAERASGEHPAAEAEARKLEEDQQAEFHGPATAMLDSLQPFNIEGGEGKVHQMQARHAKLAIQQALKDARRHVVKAADVRPLIRDHPWIALGGSAALGFVAASLLIPSEKQRAASRLRALERAIDSEARAGGRRLPREAGGSRLLRLGWRLARPTLLSFVTGALSGAATGAATGSEAGAQSGQQAQAGGEPAGGEAPPMADVT